jgi:hypothetical protein
MFYKNLRKKSQVKAKQNPTLNKIICGICYGIATVFASAFAEPN